MLKLRHNIIVGLVTAFLILALSGVSIAVHHEHSIEKQPSGFIVGDKTNDGSQSIIQNAPSTYHEVHFVKFLSGDSFKNSQQIDFKTSFQKLGFIQLDDFQLSPCVHFTPLANKTLHDIGPPSADKCTLFCSFLI